MYAYLGKFLTHIIFFHLILHSLLLAIIRAIMSLLYVTSLQVRYSTYVRRYEITNKRKSYSESIGKQIVRNCRFFRYCVTEYKISFEFKCRPKN